MADSEWLVTATIVAPVACAMVLLVVLLRRQQRERDRMAHRDPLTGLGNRTALMARAKELLLRMPPDEEADGDGDHGPALLLIDLDGFKNVNDTLGHAAGDLLLDQVAQRLATGAGPGTDVMRLGGDEFAVLVEGPVSATQASMVGKKLLAALGAGGFTAAGVALDVGASIGVVVAHSRRVTLTDLLKHADVAMYAAKRTRSGVLVYTPDLDPHSSDRLGTLSLLRGAMDDGQLELRYQPVVAADDQRLLGFETLLRWRHPTRGLLLPAEFLPLAERTALIRPLTRWVLLTALRQGSTWRSEGLQATIAVNVSAAVLEPGLLGMIDEALALTRWPPDQLVLEITESALAQNPAEAVSVVGRLRERGVHVAIDDFGAGFTGLGQLRGLPVQVLKIDRQFVAGVGVDATDEAIVTTIVELAHRLGMRVIAEGVETADVARRLHAMGCDELQGFGLGRPMDAPGVEAWMRTRRSPATTALSVRRPERTHEPSA